MAEATLTAVETRTSSPIQITTGQRHIYRALMYKVCIPAGEGAGYAGGILSAGY